MTTFSILVDKMVTEVLRPDLRDAIASYVNQAVREMHFKPGAMAPVLFDANRSEDEQAIAVDDVFLWTIPFAPTFHDIESIYLPEIGQYAKKKNPRISKEYSTEPFSEIYYYRGGNVIAISGVRSGWTAQISYFSFPRSLAYKAEANRVITYDPDTGVYGRKNGGTPSEAELNAETHWMLQRWDTTIEEGVRSKVWKRLGDGDRARMYFSGFEGMRSSLWAAEPSS